jgi:hypothetical protein
MAGSAPNSVLNVSAVIEVNEIRKIMNSVPLQRCSVLIAISNWLQYRAVLPNLGVAGHASLHRRNSCKGALFH